MESLTTAAYPAPRSEFHPAFTGLVQRVHRAYRAGRLLSADTSIVASLREFLAGMEQLAADRLARRELLFVSRCKGYCDEARHAADRNEIPSACRFISAAQMFADSRQIGPEARLLCRSEIVPAEAYMDEVCGDFHLARKRVLESLSIDQELEEQWGYAGTHAHRLHLLNRLVRLEAAISGLIPAMRLAASVFRYQSGKQFQPPVPGKWGPEYKCHLSPAFLRFFTVQLVMEIAGMVAEVQAAHLRPAIEIILDSAAFEEDGAFWSSRVRAWMELKALSTSDMSGYLVRCADYLAWPAARVPALWNTTALDAAIVCSALSPEQSLPLREDILRDLESGHNLPRQLRRVIARMRAEIGWAPVSRPTACKVLL
jgi:hypothetical protein